MSNKAGGCHAQGWLAAADASGEDLHDDQQAVHVLYGTHVRVDKGQIVSCGAVR